jgi:hypothetical protein
MEQSGVKWSGVERSGMQLICERAFVDDKLRKNQW